MLPPAIIRLRIVENGRRRIGLWLPVFLAWPLLILLFVACLPLLSVVMIALWWNVGVRRKILKILGIFKVICSLRGLKVQVDGDQDEVLIKVV